MILRTKKDYQELLLSLLEPLIGKYSSGGARLYLTGAGAAYPRQIMEMEAFARPLWGLVPFWAGGGRLDSLEKIYRQGIAAGTDAASEEYWGNCEDYDQRFVEMAPIALALLMTPEILWEPLTGRQQENLAAWLNQINQHELPKCNWYFFRILVNLALKKRACTYSRKLLQADLAFIESCYLGGGWYVDGDSRQKDYYSAFAMQYYSLIYGMFAADFDKQRAMDFKQRAGEFAGDFIYWFDKSGAALPYGRSLTYRFAQPAFWSALLWAGSSPYDEGILKGIINRNIEFWLSQPIFQNDGSLSIGYAYPNLTMAEKYNAPGSPYWCLKVFLFLALPDNHSFWQAEAQMLPRLEGLWRQIKADMLLQHRGWEVTAYVPAIYNQNVLGHFVEKYGKFAYSSVFSFSVSHSMENLMEAAPDSMLAFIPEDEEQVYVRRRSIYYEIKENHIISAWSPRTGILVTTEIYPDSQGHLRRHVIEANKPGEAYDCGFAVDCYTNGYVQALSGERSEARNHYHGCRLTGLLGNGIPWLIEADPNTNLMCKNTRIPAIKYKIKPGRTIIETRVEAWSHFERWDGNEE